MLKNPIFSAYSLLLLGSAAFAQWTGFGLNPATPIKDVPKSVRENPGVYRSHYAFLPRWFGGK
ncbi:MAG: hypothetical protein KJZ79_14900 [Bryobacteraceae bacterium]|jgi:hypothetical protein|nr:hypothetical protein [Bryobacteraceae bacterium]HAX44133.1 hypothetical protein [Bryobacterales bacterium]HRJ21630.1 hypothetical protein [Bryobacteraceae bacterium]